MKTSPAVLGKSIKFRGGKYRLISLLQPKGFFLSDAFPKWSVRRGFDWGLVMSNEKYTDEILPRLLEGRQFKEAIDLYRASKLL